MYAGSVKWPLLTGGPVLGRHVRYFPQKPRYFHSICSYELRRGSDRSARTRARLLLSEKFLSVYFIANDRMIIALREFLINRDNFSRNR